MADALLNCARIEGLGRGDRFLISGQSLPWAEFFGHYGRILGVAEATRAIPDYSLPGARARNWLRRAFFRVVRVHPKAGTDPWFPDEGLLRQYRRARPVSTRHAQAKLSWSPATDLVEGMRRTEKWLTQALLEPI